MYILIPPLDRKIEISNFFNYLHDVANTQSSDVIIFGHPGHFFSLQLLKVEFASKMN